MDLSRLNKQQKKAYVVGLFETGLTVHEVVQKTGITAPTILKYKKEYDEELEIQDITELVAQANTEQVHTVVETEMLIENSDAPEEVRNKLLDDLEDATASVKGLEVLNVSLQTAAISIANRVTNMAASSIVTPTELDRLAGALCKIQESFFNPNTTNVNILNQSGAETDVSFSKYMRD